MIDELIDQSGTLKQLYSLKMTESDIREEMEKFAPSILNWVQKYILKGTLIF